MARGSNDSSQSSPPPDDHNQRGDLIASDTFSQQSRVIGNTSSTSTPTDPSVSICSFNNRGTSTKKLVDVVNNGLKILTGGRDRGSVSGESTKSHNNNHCFGTEFSFNCNKGSQNFKDAVINSGQHSGKSGRSDYSSGSWEQQHGVCGGTQSSFNCSGGSQDFSGGEINSGANSGNI